MTSACRAAIRRDRVSPPRGFGSKLPVVRRWASQRITEDTDTPKRPTAARRLIPASTAASVRHLESIDSALLISPLRHLPRGAESQKRIALEIPEPIQTEKSPL